MSSTLYWEIPKPPRNSLSSAMKFLLRDRYDSDFDVVLDQQSDDWLSGVVAAGSGEAKADAAKLRELIKKHGSVRVWESYE